MHVLHNTRNKCALLSFILLNLKLFVVKKRKFLNNNEIGISNWIEGSIRSAFSAFLFSSRSLLFPSPEVARIDAMVHLLDHLHSCEPILLNVVTKATPVSYIGNNNGILQHLIFAFPETLQYRFVEDRSLTDETIAICAT